MSTAAKSSGQFVRQPSGYFVGFNNGFKVTKILKKKRAADRKGHFGPRHILAREIVREVAGFSGYEMRVLEFLRNGLDKKALRLAKRKVGSHQRGKKKREELTRIIAAQNLAKAKKQ
jgi:large subunit ribosomal protein L36e